MSEKDTAKDFEEAYREALDHWSPYLAEAAQDLAQALGDQWSPADRAYLDSERRAALVFNKIHRVLKLVGGFQRKNRLSLRVDPVEDSDAATASQLSAVLLWQLSYSGGDNVLSDAFENGALTTGANLVHLYMDYAEDPVFGDIKLARVPYNRFLLDPSFTRRNLEDCSYVLRREFRDENAVRAILPASARKRLAGIRPGGPDGKYPQGGAPYGSGLRRLFRVDEFWRRGSSEIRLLLDPKTGQASRFSGTDEDLAEILAAFPDLSIATAVCRDVTLDILVEGEPVYQGPEPSGLTDFPFVPVMGFFTPECPAPRYRLQGIVRCMRDPQAEVNRRRSKMIDILDSQLSSGWLAAENSVVNPDSLYGAGQGKVIWLRANRSAADVSRLPPPQFPQGLFEAMELLDRDIMEIPGANSELLGMPDASGAQVAGILSKLRQASGLTILQDLFDNYRLAQKLVGQKMIRMIQENYGPEKIRRITGGTPSPEFYSKDFGKYDAVPVEGVLSDTERQVRFAQLVELKRMGAPISWEALIEASPLENKDRLLAGMSAKA